MAALLASARAGEEAALDELFGATQSAVHALVEVRLRARGLWTVARDHELQLGLLRALRRLEAFEGDAFHELVEWAARCCEDLLLPERGAHLRLEHASPSSSDPHELARDDAPALDSQQRLLRAIAELEPKEREIVLLIGFADGPLHWVARTLGCGRRHVERLRQLALARLRLRMSD